MRVYTIKDVAKQAGVSTATVSRVINNAEGVRPDTVQKVRDAINKVNYIPNNVARNLKTDTSNVIGLLVSNLGNPHFTKMAKAIEATLRDKGISLMVCSTDDDPKKELSYLQQMIGMNVDGIILNTTGENNDRICELSHNIPITLVDRSIPNDDFTGDFVGSNGFGGVRALTKHLIDRGHRDIAIITSNLATSTGRERLAGFCDAMLSIGVTVDDQYVYRYSAGNFDEDSGVAACKHFMSLDQRPTAIVVANNEMAIGVYKYLQEKGVRVPDDVSVVSFGNISNSELFKIQPTFATLNPTFIGEKAAKLIQSRISNPAAGSREVIFEPLLVLNESTAAI